MYMPKLKDFAQARIKEIENLEPADQGDLLEQIEEKIALDQLNELLYENAQSEQELYLNHFKPFCELFSIRWHGIKKTTEHYLLNRDSLANRAYTLCAIKVSKFLQMDYKLLLMPISLDPDFVLDAKESKKMLLQHILNFAPRLNLLVELLMKHLANQQWRVFLSLISDNDLELIILAGKDLDTVLHDKKNFINNNHYNRVVLLLLTEVYKRQCAQEKESKWPGACSKEDKLLAAAVLQQFLCSQFTLDKLRGYVNKLRHEKRNEIAFALFFDLTLKGSRLKNIATQTENLYDLDHFFKETPADYFWGVMSDVRKKIGGK